MSENKVDKTTPYICSACNKINHINIKNVIICKECGNRILFKEKDKTPKRYNAI